MAWVDLPPRLRDRTSRVGVLEALAALIGTPAFAVLWLAGPVAVTALFLARGQDMLAAVAAPLAALWTVAMIRQPLALGMLVATPMAFKSVVQQVRGKVDTEDLDKGRLVPLRPWRALHDDEWAVLERLVAATGIPELPAQVVAAEVMAECVCGCASVQLYPRAPSIPRAAERGNAGGELDALRVSAVGQGADGRRLTVALQLRLGHLEELEVTAGAGHDGTADALPAARTLRVI